MSPEQRTAVSTWLYGLNRVEWAIENLDRDIELIEHQLSKGRVKATQYDRVYCSNSNISYPTELGALAEEGYSGAQERLDYLLILREEYNRNITDYEATIKRMVADERWGQLGKDIIYAKFRKKTAPDEKIYTTIVFCAGRTFYWTLNKALDFFVDVLPSRFRKDCSFVAVNSSKSVLL